MKKILLHFTTIVIILLLGACNNEEIFDKNDNNPALPTGRTLSLTAAMPGDDPTTRVGLEQLGDKSIELTWEKTDELQLAFVQGETKIKGSAKVISISKDRKKAQFEILIPADITDEAFDLYGVYGGNGLDETDPTLVKLPENAGNAGSLATIKSRKDVMLHFAVKNMQTGKTPVSVTFKHLGSLFSITFADAITQDMLDQIEANKITQARLVGVNNEGNVNWAYNAGAAVGNSFDLVAGKFKNTEASGNYISLSITNSDLTIGQPLTVWAWYPPLADANWPELALELRSASDVVATTSANTKPARTAPTAAGQSFYLYAAWNGTKLNFTDESFTPNLDPGRYHVMPMGSLSTMLNKMQRDTITTMIITGEINKADFDVMKMEIPNLTFVDLKDVTCEGNKIPDHAFGQLKDGNTTISTIILPLSTTSIGEGAFYKCIGLTGSLTIPERVTSIGRYAFSDCYALTGSLTIPEGVTSIGQEAFNSCTGFNGPLKIPSGLTEIEPMVFLACEGLTGSLIIPEGVKKIGYSAFNRCKGLTGALIIPEGVTEIEANTFRECVGFTELKLPSKLTKIGNAAFHGCINISGTVTFPTGLTNINIEGFYRCLKINAFRFPQTTPLEYSTRVFPPKVTMEVPNGTVATYKAAEGWKDHTIVGYGTPKYVYNVMPMGTLNTMLNQTQLDTITTMIVTGEINKADFDVMKLKMPKLRYLDLSNVACEKNRIPDEAIGGYRNPNTTISTIILPKSITEIGHSSFKTCTSLTGRLIIPERVTTIENKAFENCYNLTGFLSIPEGVTTIGDEAFRENNFTGLKLPSGLTTIGAAAFISNKNITGKLAIPASVTNIGKLAFWECYGIDGFQFPHITPIEYTESMIPRDVPVHVHINAIDTYQEYNNKSWSRHPIVGGYGAPVYNVSTMGSLSSILGNRKSTIEQMKLTGYLNVEDFKVMNEQMPKLKYLDLSDVTCEENKIPIAAFSKNATLEIIVLPNNITKICDYAFSECTALAKYRNPMDIPETVTTMGFYALYMPNPIQSKAVRFRSHNPIPYFSVISIPFIWDRTHIYVPHSALEKYKQAQGWSAHNSDYLNGY